MEQQQSALSALRPEEAYNLSVRRKVENNFLDLSPDEARYAHQNSWLNVTQLKNYLDYQENPVSYHFRDGLQGVVKGFRDAGQEILESGTSLLRWVSQNEDLEAPQLPEVEGVDTVTGNVVSGITQFTSAFVPYLGVVGKVGKLGKLAQLGQQFPKLSRVIHTSVAGMLTDATAFDPRASNLADIIEEIPSLRTPLTGYLKSNPDDPEWEARMKRALEGALLGLPIEGAFYLFKFMRGQYWRHGGQRPDRVAKLVDEAIPAGEGAVKGEASHTVQEGIPIPQPTAKPQVKLSDEEAGKIFKEMFQVVEDAKTGQTKFSINPAFNLDRIDGPDEMLKILDKLAESSSETFKKFTRGVEGRDVTHAKAQEYLKDLGGITGEAIDDLMKTWRFMDQGPGFAAKVQSYRQLMVSYLDHITELARKGADGSIEEALKAQEHIKQFTEVMHLFKGVQTHLARGLGAFNNVMKGERFNFKALGPELLGEIENTSGRELRKRLKAFTELKDPYARAQFARTLGRSRFLAGLLEWRQAALLSNPGSLVVNIAGNMAALTIDKLSRYMALTGQAITKADVRILGEIGADFHGLMRGFWDAIRLPSNEVKKMGKTWTDVYKEHGLKAAFGATEDAVRKMDELGSMWKALYTGDSWTDALTKLDDAVGHGGNVPGWAGGPIIRTPFKFLAATDEVFKSMAYRSEINALAYREALHAGKHGQDMVEFMARIVDEPGEKLHLEALKRAREVTFTAPLGEVAGKMSSLLNTPAMLPVRIMFFPFFKVPVNLAKFAATRSPLAIMSKRIRDDILAGGMRASDALSRIATGTGLMALGAMWYNEGKLTGSFMESEREDMKNAGVPEYAIRFGDKWVRYNRTDPVAMWLGVAADTAKWFERYNLPESKTDELITAGILIITNNLLSKTYLQSISEMSDIMFHPERRDIGKFLRTQTATFMPFSTGLDAMARQNDPHFREHDTFFEAAIKTRFSPEDLVPRRHAVYGTPIIREPRVLMAYDSMTPTDDPVLQEMVRVNANIGPMRKTFEFKGEKIELNIRQLNELQAILSELPLQENLMKIINSPRYQGIKDSETQKDILRKVVTAHRDAAKKLYLSRNPELLQEIREKLALKSGAIQGMYTSPSVTEKLGHWETYLRIN